MPAPRDRAGPGAGPRAHRAPGAPRSGAPWLPTALALALGSGALALARFGYTVVLPAMRAELGWSYTQAGAMNSANALGYLAGAVVAAPLIAVLGARRSFTAAFATTAATVAACGLVTGYPSLLALRATTGAAAAVLFLAGAVLATRLAGASSSPGLVLGIYFAGVGPGIAVSALLAPTALSAAHAWRPSWLLMGTIAAVAAVPAARAARAVPAVAAPADARAGPRGSLRWALTAFALFGPGYVSYMTFIVAYYEDAGHTGTRITLFWAVLSVAATCSAWVWQRLVDASPGRALAVLLAVTAVGAALPVTSDATGAMLGSAVLFGGAFLSVIAAVTQLVRRTLPPARVGFGLAITTNLFAAGQAVGPLLTGALADRTGSLRGGLAASALLLGVAAGAAAFQDQPDDPGALRPRDARRRGATSRRGAPNR